MALAAGTEGAAGRGANTGFVDEPQRQRTGIGKAVDREEEIERRLRLEEPDAPGCGEPLAQNIARAATALDLPGKERFALLERRRRRALIEHGHARGRVLDEVLDHSAKLRRGLQPADAETGHRPVLGQSL